MKSLGPHLKIKKIKKIKMKRKEKERKRGLAKLLGAKKCFEVVKNPLLISKRRS